MLDDLARRLQSPKPRLVARERAEAAGVALAAAIQALQTATDCFDEAIRRNSGSHRGLPRSRAGGPPAGAIRGHLGPAGGFRSELGAVAQTVLSRAGPAAREARSRDRVRADGFQRRHREVARRARPSGTRDGGEEGRFGCGQCDREAIRCASGQTRRWRWARAEPARNGAGQDEPDDRAGQTSAVRRRIRRGIQDHRGQGGARSSTPKSTMPRPRWTRATARSTAASTCSGPGNRPTPRARRAIMPGPKA